MRSIELVVRNGGAVLSLQCTNQKQTISNLKEALEGLKRDSVSQSSPRYLHKNNQNSTSNNNRSIWNWLKHRA